MSAFIKTLMVGAILASGISLAAGGGVGGARAETGNGVPTRRPEIK